MLEKSLLRFAEENFSDKYCASLHGETKRIRPLALIVKRHRSMFKRPFGKHELIILEGLEKYVEGEGGEEFCKALNKIIAEEGLDMEPKLSLGKSSHQFGVDISGDLEVTVKQFEENGDLGLGKLSQKYVTDPDIRGLLADTALDVKKMEPYNQDELLLITSVIYSEKFELTGVRKQEGNYKAVLRPVPWSANSVFGSAGYKTQETPPGVAVRNFQGPLLFKWCRVEYNKKTNRLEISKGEYIGKTVYHQINRDVESTPKAEDGENYDFIVSCNLDETDSQEYSVEDVMKLGAIEKELLLPGVNRTQRKARISKYLHWFEESLSTDQHKLTLDKPLVKEDCDLLRQLYLPCAEASTMLDLTSLSKEDVQSFGIVFNALDNSNLFIPRSQDNVSASNSRTPRGDERKTKL